jgi:hypothetical protein
LDGGREEGKFISVIQRIITIATALFTVACTAVSESGSLSPSTSLLDLSKNSTSTTSVSTSTTPLFISNLELHVEPAALHIPETQFLIDVLIQMEQRYPVRPGTKAILYTSSENAFQWVRQTVRETLCFQDKRRSEIMDSVGWGAECGLLMRIDVMRYYCGSGEPCKQSRTVAAHEFFHVFALQRLQGCSCEPRIYGNKVPNWINEGIADYVGYAAIFGEIPGSFSAQELAKLRATNKVSGHNDSFAVSLKKLEDLFQGDLSQPRGHLYDRSFLAVSYLVEKFGEKAVVIDFFDNVARTGHYTSGFKETFGMSENDFDKEFQAWVASL